MLSFTKEFFELCVSVHSSRPLYIHTHYNQLLQSVTYLQALEIPAILHTYRP